MSGRVRKYMIRAIVLAAIATAATVWGKDAYRLAEPYARGAYQAVAGREDASAADSAVRFHTVGRGKLTISLVERGQLRAVKQHNIATWLKNAKISWVVKAGATVKKGDKLICFESKSIEDQISARETEVEAAQRQLVVVEENLKIEQSSGKAMVAGAQTKLEEAQKALKQFREVDSPKTFRTQSDAIDASRKALTDAMTNCRDTQQKADEGMTGDEKARQDAEAQLATATLQQKAATKKLEMDLLAHKMFKSYDYPQTLKARQQAVDNADLELKKSSISAQSSMLAKQAEVAKVRDQIRRAEADIRKLQGDLKATTICAPADGMVIFGDPTRNMYMVSGNDMEPKVGNECYPGYTIMNIPDFSAFVIDISVGEDYFGRLKAGSKSIITIEAIPGLSLDGTLKSIEIMAQSKNPYDRNSPKVHPSVVELKNSDTRIVSGMSARVELIAETLDNVLLAPIESVFNEDGQTVCYVRSGAGYEKRVVKTGKSNDDLVEICEGLQEGQNVYLFNPRQVGSK